MENVWSLAYKNHNAVPLSRLTTRLEEAGYRVRWEVLNAADFGVPQLRKRMILYATLGTEPPELPRPTHSGWTETKRRFDASLTPYVTSRQTIGDLEDRAELAERDEQVNGEYGALLPAIPPGENYLLFTEKRGSRSPSSAGAAATGRSCSSSIPSDRRRRSRASRGRTWGRSTGTTDGCGSSRRSDSRRSRTTTWSSRGTDAPGSISSATRCRRC